MTGQKIPLRQVILVEGKYDVIRLHSLFDALILRTDGFRIFRDRERQQLLRRLAQRNGVILLTDSDAAGFQIRAFLKDILPKDQMWQVYIPDVQGKERRKALPSKEGKLGVEGMEARVLLEAFRRAGVLEEQSGAEQSAAHITKLMLYQDGFSGTPGSRARLQALLRELELPERLSSNGLAQVLSASVSGEEYRAAVAALRQKGV
ncbi:MAG: DUF4093 domain-containing protein [Oscillospiraceae bacterium]|nr:DUF4093 domain-containing protein [Oscillospiraceae bacterium]